VKLRRGEGGATEDHALRRLRPEFSGEKAVSAHAGKEVEKDLRETETGVFLRDHEIRG
jgi:hypothetical protein